MLKVSLIGNLGADVEIKESNGSKFATMRVAHTNRYRTESGEQREQTIWVDVTWNNMESEVLKFLKAGTKIFVRGNASLRVYSSQKDRCMKAGLTIAAHEIELCGGSSDAVPRQLIVPDSGQVVDVAKFYQANIDTKNFKKDDVAVLFDTRGNHYNLVKGGWVAPAVNEPANDPV